MRAERDQIKTLLIVVGIVAVFVGAVWYPMHRKQTKIRSDIKELSDAIQSGRTATVGLPAMGHQIVLLEQKINGSDKYVPHDPDLASLMRQWTTQLKDNDVRDEEIQTQSVVRGDEFSMIPIKLKFRGSFEAVFSYLRYVEQMNRLSRFNTVKVESSLSKTEEPLRVEIEMCTFYGPGEGGE